MQIIKTMAIELAPKGIRINAIAPGVVLTERMRGHAAGPGADGHKAKMARVLAGREATPEEVAGAVAWLLSPAPACCIGSLLTLDDGYMLGIPGYCTVWTNRVTNGGCTACHRARRSFRVHSADRCAV